jgi:hypothetical protein
VKTGEGPEALRELLSRGSLCDVLTIGPPEVPVKLAGVNEASQYLTLLIRYYVLSTGKFYLKLKDEEEDDLNHGVSLDTEIVDLLVSESENMRKALVPLLNFMKEKNEKEDEFTDIATRVLFKKEIKEIEEAPDGKPTEERTFNDFDKF